MAEISRKHHTVPHFYLRGFATGSRQIGTVQLPGTKRFVQSTSRASAHTDFYAIPEHEDGPDAFEKDLSRMEGEAAGVIRRITEERVWPLPPEDRDMLAAFLTVQFLRGPEQRRHMEETRSLVTQMEIGFGGKANVAAWVKRKHGISVSEEQAAQIWDEATQPGGPPIRLAPVVHINQMLQLTPKLVRYFTFRPWMLYRFSARSLVTCDTPLSLIPHPSRQADYSESIPEGVGLMTAWGITFPLTRKIGLLLGNPEEFFGHVDAEDVATGRFDSSPAPSTAVSKLFNAATIDNARQWIFHHPNDAYLVPQDLPHPRDKEIHVMGGPGDFSGDPLSGFTQPG